MIKIKTEELIKALEYYRKKGSCAELQIEVDTNLHHRLILIGDCLGDRVVVTLFNSELNVFPKKTVTDNL